MLAGHLGQITDEIGDKQDALHAYEESLAIRDRLARANPSSTAFQSALAQSHDNIGALQSEMGRAAEALASDQHARAIWERLAQENPTFTDYRKGLAISYNNIGIVQGQTGLLADALEGRTTHARSASVWRATSRLSRCSGVHSPRVSTTSP